MNSGPPILDKIIGKEPTSEDIDIYEVGSDYNAFGVSRKAWGTEPMIDFITKDGNHHSFAYSHMYFISMDPSSSITIDFTSHSIVVSGTGLREIYRELFRNRVTFIAQADLSTISLSVRVTVSDVSISDRTNP
ncbi:MAG: hypothetical protein AAGA30_00960 [Planctomycetota bacterium]